MDLFMPAERVLYDRAYYLSDEAERDYALEVAEEHGIDVGEVLYSDELMEEVRDALDRDIDLYLDDEIANFDSMLRELKRGEDPEHPAESTRTARSASRPPIMTAPPIWMSGSSPGCRSTARGSGSAASSTRPVRWT